MARSLLYELWIEWLRREKCVPSAILYLISTILLVGALCEEQWIRVEDGACPYNFLGLINFYGGGTFEHWYSRPAGSENFFTSSDSPAAVFFPGDTLKFQQTLKPVAHNAYHTGHRVFVDCVTHRIVDIFHILIGVCCAATICSFVSFIFDLFGAVPKSTLARLRRTSIFGFFSVIISCIGICLTLWLCFLIADFQRSVDSDSRKVVRISVADGFYFVFVASLAAICGVCVNAISMIVVLRLRRRSEDMRSLLTGAGRNSTDSSGTQQQSAAVLLPLHLSASSAAHASERHREGGDLDRLSKVIIPQYLDYLAPQPHPTLVLQCKDDAEDVQSDSVST